MDSNLVAEAGTEDSARKQLFIRLACLIVVGGSVAVAVMWRQIFGSEGVINGFTSFFGIPAVNWLGDPRTAIWTLIILAIWQFGSPMIIFLAGLRQIPQDLYEAASMDGASKFRQFYRITLPLLAPVIFFNMVLQVIEGFKAFTPAFIISGGTGNPINSTLFYTLYLYQEAFANFRMGYASALAWIFLIIVLALTLVQFRLSNRWVFYAGAGNDAESKES